MKKILRTGILILTVLIGVLGCDELTDPLGEDQQNSSPVAVAGSDQEASIGETVLLDGSNSMDPDGDTLNYQWELLSKPDASEANIENSTSVAASFVADTRGSYQVKLTVSDGTDSDNDALSVTADIETIGDINENTTLTSVFEDPAEPDYAVSGVSDVNAVLTIEPGVTIEFGEGARMDIESSGTLIAVGTETDSIIFTGATKSPGSWDGIHIKSTSVDNEISYASALYGGADTYANIYISYNGAAKISHTRSDKSSTYGFVAENGAGIREFAENSFNGNASGALSISANLIGSLDANSSYAGTDGEGIIAVSSSDVTTDQTWPATDAPYIMDGVTNVGSVVTVDPGAVFKFTQGSRLDIEGDSGSLIAVGNADSSIQFQGTQELAGHWDGIYFQNITPTNELSYVEISHGGADSYANVYVNYNGGVKITNSRFTMSGTYGLDVEGGGILRGFEENTFEADAGVHIPAYLIGALDAASTYTGSDGTGVISVSSSDVTTDQTWSATDAPYIMDGVTNVEAVVTVKPGALFKFTQGSRLDVEGDTGSLIAVGTADSSIQFLGTQPVAGHWDGIYIQNNIPTNELTYTVLSYGGGDSYANVYVNYNGGVKITNSQFSASATYGIDVESGGQIHQFASNTFTENALVNIPDYLMGVLDENSSYLGDGTGYISVFGSGSDVTTDQTWPATDAPFRIDGTVDILADVVISPGAVLQFTVSSRLDVQSGTNGGSLTAVGTSTDSIKFLGTTDVQGHWDGLRFSVVSTDNLLEYCLIANGGADGYANVYVDYNGSATVNNSTLRDSETYGVEIENGGAFTGSGNVHINNALGDVMDHNN
ncbi:MAG: hypothetical protein K9N46_08965 [Candidatus Marinimicrobia bacterium]|nr:hypothetical protein [Candidatus Neomarinimicrobiota bacterium]MCF7829369.1 hypothetical protein [Candidatus Neomarinimicrobiota bacterium]MCF7880855.1 hypothetical protein [Candidatus Neomarinimicrobiota bacterium]